MPTLPSLRPNVWVGAGLVLGLGLGEGRVGTSPETWIDPKSSAQLPEICRFSSYMTGIPIL